MKTRIAILFVSLLLFAPMGCVAQAVKDQVKKSAGASDKYASAVVATLDGTIRIPNGLPVTAADLAATPPSVKLLLTNVIRGLYLMRKGWHQANFAANDGPDPSTLDLAAPPLPQ